MVEKIVEKTNCGLTTEKHLMYEGGNPK